MFAWGCCAFSLYFQLWAGFVGLTVLLHCVLVCLVILGSFGVLRLVGVCYFGRLCICWFCFCLYAFVRFCLMLRFTWVGFAGVLGFGFEYFVIFVGCV